MLRRFTVRPDAPLEAVVGEDPEARIATWPRHLSIKGMFFTHLMEILGPDAEKVTDRFEVPPPRGGRYFPFVDYPQTDHGHLFIAAARKKHPGVPLPEAMRRIGRMNFDAFLTSTIGQVMANLVRDAEAALLKFPEAMKVVHHVGSITSQVVEPRCVRIEYRGYVGWLDSAMIGGVEAVVSNWARPPTIEVELLDLSDANYLVRW